MIPVKEVVKTKTETAIVPPASSKATVNFIHSLVKLYCVSIILVGGFENIRGGLMLIEVGAQSIVF